MAFFVKDEEFIDI